MNVTKNPICSNAVSVAGIRVAQPEVLKLSLKGPLCLSSCWLARVSVHQSASPRAKIGQCGWGLVLAVNGIYQYEALRLKPLASLVVIPARVGGPSYLFFLKEGPPFSKCRPRAQKNVRNS